MAAMILLIVGLLILVGIVVTKHQHDLFAERFPPISDAEFVIRCGPGTNPDIALSVRRIVSEQLGVEYDRIHPSCRFVEDLGCD